MNTLAWFSWLVFKAIVKPNLKMWLLFVPFKKKKQQHIVFQCPKTHSEWKDGNRIGKVLSEYHLIIDPRFSFSIDPIFSRIGAMMDRNLKDTISADKASSHCFYFFIIGLTTHKGPSSPWPLWLLKKSLPFIKGEEQQLSIQGETVSQTYTVFTWVICLHTSCQK